MLYTDLEKENTNIHKCEPYIVLWWLQCAKEKQLYTLKCRMQPLYHKNSTVSLQNTIEYSGFIKSNTKINYRCFIQIRAVGISSNSCMLLTNQQTA